jgi:hypothetical protein
VAVVEEERGGARDRFEHVLHAGANAVLRRSPSRRWRERLHGARQVEQERTLGVVEPQRPGERIEHAVRDAGHVTALKPGVVRNAHASQDRDLLAAQARNAPGTVVRQPDVGGVQPRPAGGEELPDLAAGVHRLTRA